MVDYDKRLYFERRIRKKVGSAIRDYAMIGPSDKVIVAMSGGKDSIVLLKVLTALRKAAPLTFNLVPVHIRTGFEDGFERIAFWSREELGLEVMEVETNIARIIKEVADPEKSACAFCSRMRRGYLYGVAQAIGASSIALGHHMDDIIETFFLRCFYTGQIGAMAPSRVSNDGKNRVIRPLAYCPDDLVDAFFRYLEIEPAINDCPLRVDSKRKMMRAYIADLQRDIPRVKYSVFASLSNIDMKSMCLKG